MEDTPALPSLERAREKLLSLRDLPENWNTYGSPPIEEAAIKAGERFLDLLSTMAVVPVSGGGVQFEIGGALEIEFLPDGSCEVLVEFTDGQITAGTITNAPRKE